MTIVPGEPEVGLNELIDKALAEKLAVAQGLVTLAVVKLPPKGIVTLICAGLITVNDGQLTPFSFTCVAPAKLAPAMVTTVPIEPETGDTPDITGEAVTVTVVLPVAVQPLVPVTVTV